MFFGLLGNNVDVIFSGVGIVNVLQEDTGELDMFVVSFFAWCEFKFFIEGVFVSVDIFVDIVQVDIIFDFINDEGDSPEGFIEVVVVPDVTDWIEEPGKEDFCLIEIVDFFDGLLDFFKVGFFAFFLDKS